MQGVNKVIIIGRLGADPESKTYGVHNNCQLSIATEESFKTKNGEKKKNVEWHRVTCWDQIADFAALYLKKGSKVYVEAKLKTDKWVDEKTGQDRYKLGILATSIQSLDSKQESGDKNNGDYKGHHENYNPATGSRESDDMQDDDIPF